jgi:hypothetical protein
MQVGPDIRARRYVCPSLFPSSWLFSQDENPVMPFQVIWETSHLFIDIIFHEFRIPRVPLAFYFNIPIWLFLALFL